MADQYVQCPHCGRMEHTDGVHTCVGDNLQPALPPATRKESLQVAASDREGIAKVIYGAMQKHSPEGAHYPWQDGGNSDAQMTAREAADAILAATRTASTEPGADSPLLALAKLGRQALAEVVTPTMDSDIAATAKALGLAYTACYDECGDEAECDCSDEWHMSPLASRALEILAAALRASDGGEG